MRIRVVSRWFCAGDIATATFTIPGATMVIITVASYIGGAIAVGQTRYTAVVMRPAYIAMITMGARAVDVMAAAAAIPSAAMVVVGVSPYIDGGIAMR